jgi:serine/threonine protein kinase
MELAGVLSSMPVFSGLGREAVDRLASAAERCTFAPDDRIVARGDPGDAMYVIERGSVRVPVVDDDGKHLLTKYLGPGDVFGEMALVTGEPRGADVLADGDIECRCLRLSKDVVHDLMRQHPPLARLLTDVVGKRLLESGQVRSVGKYRIVGEIGRGGIAMVFEGLHPTLGRSVAVKMLSHELVFEGDFKERFLAEAKLVSELRHDNIVQVYDQESAYATFFIVMERLDGVELSDVVAKQGALPADEVRMVLQQVARGLQYAHRKGVIHRDIKPANIFREDNGRVKVMDFGIATSAAGGGDVGGVMGTPGYIAPEAMMGEPADARADIYAVGVMAYELLVGRHPFAHKDKREVLKRQLQATSVNPREVMRSVPGALSAFVDRATQQDPARRFQSCGEMLEALDASMPMTVSDRERVKLEIDYPSSARARMRALLDQLRSDVEGEIPDVHFRER